MRAVAGQAAQDRAADGGAAQDRASTAEPLLAAAQASGLVRPGAPLLVMLSGGADSTCLLDVALRLEARVSALHVNYGLRDEAHGDEQLCRAVCERAEVPLTVERVELDAPSGPGVEGERGGRGNRERGGRGNLQARAREARYAAAERIASGIDADYAAAHTLSDQAETVVYRLATSPGRRALLGMAPRRGRLVRPLLSVTRAEVRQYCRERGLAWRDDASNFDPRFARARIRNEVLPVLAALSPAAERTIASTAGLLRDEAEVLETAVDEVLERGSGSALPLEELRSRPAALARLVLVRLAEGVAGPGHSISAQVADEVLELGRRGGSQSLDLGGDLRALVEYGTVRFTCLADAPAPEPVPLPVPGVARFGAWEVEARVEPSARSDPAAAPATSDPAPLADRATLDPSALGPSATVRAWRDGDRMRPAGLGGTKSLQDLFTDRKVPRALRRSLPVVEARGEIAWVAELAVGETFRPVAGAEVVTLAARRARGLGQSAPPQREPA